MQAAIDKAGRIVIPKAIREEAGLVPGGQVDVRCIHGRVEIETPAAESRLVNEGGVWVIHTPGARQIALEETNRMIRDLRERRLEESCDDYEQR